MTTTDGNEQSDLQKVSIATFVKLSDGTLKKKHEDADSPANEWKKDDNVYTKVKDLVDRFSEVKANWDSVTVESGDSVSDVLNKIAELDGREHVTFLQFQVICPYEPPNDEEDDNDNTSTDELPYLRPV
ncbi:hypothetical protein COEREDRAFT_8237 [Coemansia reversa NRRL 1564]|uniref:Uncharacterized protein n=1 Tax=Coemansia reversa (strain ATCC 12441 / NRRL 1564) TaxID=763665 RepID=A0A2G5BCM8_COERN|nr:hypothetical protein COEREDRAFT_8237 [Coemansia reversa NRRL 1564]|eukprot:PIA16768.1 hypothetical protein COEREDRAFT_8237 [Coemansia reversa NRRL 1564]